MRRPVAWCLLLLLAVSTGAIYTAAQPGGKSGKAREGTRLPAAAFAALETVNPENIRAHVRYLADDLLEGRGTGQRGGDIAAQYIASQFALYGLKPAGDNGSYLQKVPMMG